MKTAVLASRLKAARRKAAMTCVVTAGAIIAMVQVSRQAAETPGGWL